MKKLPNLLNYLLEDFQGTTKSTRKKSQELRNYAYLVDIYTLSDAWSGVNWADLMAAQGAFGTDFYDRSILCQKHRAYYRSGRPVFSVLQLELD